MKKLFALMLIVSALFVAGCTSKTETTPPADTTAPPAEEGATTTETPPAETPAQPANP